MTQNSLIEYGRKHFFGIANFILIIKISFGAGEFKKDLENHIKDESIHHSYKDMSDEFVLKSQYDDFKKDLKSDIKEIKELNNTVLKILMEQK